MPKLLNPLVVIGKPDRGTLKLIRVARDNLVSLIVTVRLLFPMPKL